MPSRLRSSSSSSQAIWGAYSACLKPTYSLRRQVLFSFGATGILTTALVVGLACVCAITAGSLVQREARNFMSQEVIHSISNSSRYAAETFSQDLDHLRGTVAVMVEIVRDRIANYPREGWEDDSRVPFVTADGGRRYPLQSPLLPRDWNVTNNVNGDNKDEHLQELFNLMLKQHDPNQNHGRDEHFQPRLSTVHAAYSFQGNCDPSVHEPSDPRYYKGCTKEHNNGTSGGIRPTPTSAGLEQKAADIGTLLKPVWESRPDLLQVSVHFVNDGAGSMLHFPSFVHSNEAQPYQSIGCDWLVENLNPYTNKPFLTKEQVEQNCHPKGEWVRPRDFNPLEQEWFRDQVLHPDDTRFFGPQVDEFFTRGALTSSRHAGHEVFFWVMRVGRAIFDRHTGELIGCVEIELLLSQWSELIMDTLSIMNYSNAVLVRENGQVMAGAAELHTTRDIKYATDMTDVIHDAKFYGELLEELEKNKAEENAAQKERKSSIRTATSVMECTTGRVLSASALPGTDFIYVQSVSEEVFEVIDDIKRSIDQDVIYSAVAAFIIGGIGMTVLMVVVYIVSLVLTRPLNWMRTVAFSIVNHSSANLEKSSLKLDDFDEELAHMQVGSNSSALMKPAESLVQCTPKTEITELVEEFKQMIRGFSGAEKASTVAKCNGHEVRNTLGFSETFFSRNMLQHGLQGFEEEGRDSSEGGDPDYLFRSAKRGEGERPEDSALSLKGSDPGLITYSREPSITTAETTMVPPSLEGKPEWKNQGRNLRPPRFSDTNSGDDRTPCIPFKSPMFRWILVLIVIPMILTNAFIVAIVSQRIASVLPRWLENVESVSFNIQLDDLSLASKFASLYAEAVLATPARDLFMMTRLAGWLFSDALPRDKDAVIEMGSGSEACKAYTENCPWYEDPFQNVPCDCGWETPITTSKCFEIGDDTRHMQRMFYSGQAHDADPLTGRRTHTSYPSVDKEAADTLWWHDLDLVPGAHKGNNASGHETTYDRLRVISTLSVVIFPLYNYRSSLMHDSEHRYLGAYFGFESDGMLAGWAGCRYPSPTYPHFQSTESNLAFKINGTLCPLGKFGYDVRCRSWYAGGKAAQEAGNTSIFLTPPYEFSTDVTASSVTQGVFDARTNEHIGQSLVDFQQFEILNFDLMDREGNFHFVITPVDDELAGDIVVPPTPGQSLVTKGASIGDLVLPFDDENAASRQFFDDQVVGKMKNGESCLKNFTRQVLVALEDENEESESLRQESTWIAFNPIYVRSLEAVQSDDFSRGLIGTKSQVYSLGVGRNLGSLERPFNQFREAAEVELNRIVAIYICLTMLISLLAAAVACRVRFLG